MANTYVKIGSTVEVGLLGAANIEFTSIPSTYTDLLMVLSLRCTRASNDTEAYIKFNNNTSSYSYIVLGASGGTGTQSSTSGSTYPPIVTDAALATAITFASTNLYIPNYAGSANKSLSVDSVAENNASGTGSASMYLVAGLWANSAAINQITITPFSGTFVQYSTATLYGISKS
jgi:hypothetical protein